MFQHIQSAVIVDSAKMNGPIIWLCLKPHQTLSLGLLIFEHKQLVICKHGAEVVYVKLFELCFEG